MTHVIIKECDDRWLKVTVRLEAPAFESYDEDVVVTVKKTNANRFFEARELDYAPLVDAATRAAWAAWHARKRNAEWAMYEELGLVQRR